MAGLSSLSTPNWLRWFAMVAVILALQAGLALWVGLPGQMSTDSIVQLYEGRTHQTISFNPPMLSILLGLLDRLGSGQIGFVLLSQAILSAATWLVLVGSRRSRFWQFGIAAVCLCNPVILAYVGIVWKDVLFAHACVLLFLLLAHWRSRQTGIQKQQILIAVLLMTLVVGLRQQGILFAAVAAAWVAAMMNLSRMGAWLATLILAAAPLLMTKLLTEMVQRPLQERVDGSAVGFKILMHYDLVGILAHQGELAPATPAKVVEEARQKIAVYTPYRVDTLTGPAVNYWVLPMGATVLVWAASIAHSPLAYWRHRVEVSLAMLGLADMQKCSPVYSGVAGPIVHPRESRELTSFLGLTPGPNHATLMVNELGWDLANTPLLQHWAYVVLLLLTMVVLALRKAHVLLSLALCSLVLLLSYFVLGIACDFRYAYTLTVATSLLVAWAVLDHAPEPRTSSQSAQQQASLRQQLGRFFFVGLFVASLDFALFMMLVRSGVSREVSNAAGMSAGFVVGLFGHHRFTFQSGVAMNWAVVLRYGGGFVINLLLGWAVLEVMFYLGAGNALSKAVTMATVVASNFLLSRNYVFRTNRTFNSREN